MLEKETLLKLHWRGSEFNNYVLLIVFALFAIFFIKNAMLDDSAEIERLKKELYKIEYVSDLTVKIEKRDFDGREFVVEKPTWLTQTSPDKYESNSKSAKLIRHNKSTKEKKGYIRNL